MEVVTVELMRGGGGVERSSPVQVVEIGWIEPNFKYCILAHEWKCLVFNSLSITCYSFAPIIW